MKQKAKSCLKNQPGWMKMMKLRKGKFDFLGRNYVLCLRVTVNSFSVNDFHVLSVFSLQC